METLNPYLVITQENNEDITSHTKIYHDSSTTIEMDDKISLRISNTSDNILVKLYDYDLAIPDKYLGRGTISFSKILENYYYSFTLRNIFSPEYTKIA